MAFYSATLIGVRPIPVEIEIDLSSGLPFFQIVGLPDAVLKESKTRVKSAILQGGYEFPFDERLVLNLAPSKIKKEGSGFELGLASRILASSSQIPAPDFNVMFLGELALDGSVRSVPEAGALSFATLDPYCGDLKIDLVVSGVEDISHLKHLRCAILPIKHIEELKGNLWWEKAKRFNEYEQKTDKSQGPNSCDTKNEVSFDDFSFTEFWTKHLEIAAVGHHHYFLCGPPGCGKTFFAESLKLLLGEISSEKNPERELLNSFFNRETDDLPFASPHHSATAIGLLGGGMPPKPGALTRAHGGVLFLDELLEFKGATLDSLREPIEKGYVEIYRAGQHVVFPSRVQVVGATNPCRCGLWGGGFDRCKCQPYHRQMYQARLSGPFFDRFDVKLVCPKPLGNENRVSGLAIKENVKRILNNKNSKVEFSKSSLLTFDKEAALQSLSFRARNKVKALSQTLARVEGKSEVNSGHIIESLELQSFKGLE